MIGIGGTWVAHRLRRTGDMKKRITHPITLFLLLFVGFPLAATAQEKQLVSRTSLGRMDVLSRARLFEATIEKAAKSEGVDPLILWTIAYNETRFRPWLTSPKNAQGLMQFMPATAARFGLTNPYEPTSSLYAAAKYVKYLGRLFDWRLESVLAAYNAGEGTVSAYLYGRNLRVKWKSNQCLATRGRSTVSRRTRKLWAMFRKAWRCIAGLSSKADSARLRLHSPPRNIARSERKNPRQRRFRKAKQFRFFTIREPVDEA